MLNHGLKITNIHAREVIDCRGFPTVEVDVWINDEFAQNGYLVAQILAFGVFVNSFGHIAQVLFQGFGSPDITAKIHIVELILYVPYLWYLTDSYGIGGAALAWSIRVCISTFVLMYLANKCLNFKI